MVTSGYENFLLEVQNHQEENYHSTSDDVAATPAKRNIYNKGNNSVFFAYRISPDLFNESVNFSVFQANKVLRSSDTQPSYSFPYLSSCLRRVVRLSQNVHINIPNNKRFVFLVQEPTGYQAGEIRDITYSADVEQQKRIRDDARGLDKLFNTLNTRRNERNYEPNGY